MSWIVEIMEHFFLSTHIPIKAFKLDGEIIGSVGYNDSLDFLFDKKQVFNKIKNNLFMNQDSTSITKELSEKISFSATYVCCKDNSRGIFIIGPYTSCKCSSNKDILYKPANCIPHIIALLHNIGRDFICNKLRKVNEEGVPYSPYVKRALEYINTNYYHPITLDDITSYLNINRCYFCTLFKKETSKTFSQLLNEIRVEKSKGLLVEGEESILDIALHVGFNNPNYFSMVFKKLTNKTPLQYRKDMS